MAGLPEPLRGALHIVPRALVPLALVATVLLGPAAHAKPPAPAPAPPVTAPVGASGPSHDAKATFEEAVNSFKYQDFDNAVPQLRTLLYPTPRVDRRREWQVREYLGASLWWVGSKNEANDEFTALLVRDATHKLDPAVYPPKMIADFETLRDNLVRLGVIKNVAQAPEPLDLAQPPPFGLMFVPFGVGQFANHSPGKGAAFLTREAAWRISSNEIAVRPLSNEHPKLVTRLAMRADDKKRLTSEFVRAAGRKLVKVQHPPQRGTALAC